MTLALENINLSLKNKASLSPLIQNLNLTIKAGEFVTIVGKSGCGKSSLLNLIAGHLPKDEYQFDGVIKLNDHIINDQEAHLRQVGLVLQQDLLFPHLTILENLTFALPDKIKKTQRKTLAYQALEDIELSVIAKQFPHQISGGQRARVSVTRTLLSKPKAILLDEPFGQLDPQTRNQFKEWTFSQLKHANIPVILVTHDLHDHPDFAQLVQL